MKIFRLFPETNDLAYIENTNLTKSDRLEIVRGELVKNLETYNIEIQNKQNKLPEFLGSGSGVHFIDGKLKELLNETLPPNKINFLPISILDKTMWLLNVICIYDIIDYEKSKIEYYGSGPIKKILRLEINDEEIDDFDIFKLKGRPGPIFITEKLKKRLEEFCIKGINYLSSRDLTKFE